jgi:hypothetical protein
VPQDELVLLAKEALPEANEDKSGVLTVTVVESRNVGAEAAESETGVDVVSDDEQSGKGVRYVVSVEPESVLSPAEEAESEVQFTVRKTFASYWRIKCVLCTHTPLVLH